MRCSAYTGARIVVFAVLMAGGGSAVAQVPDGYEMVKLTTMRLSLARPDLNNRGEVIWSDALPPSVSNIMLFSRGIVRQVTDDTHYDARARINDQGDYAYLTASDFFGFPDVRWVLAGGVVTYDAMNAANAIPDINNAGHIVWDDKFSKDASDQRVFFFDGSVVHQVTFNGLSNQASRLNNCDQIVFRERDLRKGGGSRIVLYSDGVLTPLTDSSKARGGPVINDLGQVVWHESTLEGLDDRIILWEEGDGRVFIEAEVAGPSIGNNGDITYLRENKARGLNDNWYYRSSDNQYFQLPHLGLTHGAPTSINDCGELAWLAISPDTGERVILMVRRVGPKGDFDHDCRIDLRDYSILEHCYSSQGRGPAGGLLAECVRADFDDDGDVDDEDIGEFIRNVTGRQASVQDCDAVSLCHP